MVEKKGKTERKNVRLNDSSRVHPTFGSFPVDKWADYDRDVETNWSGVRWAKAMNDHEVARRARKEDAMWEVILELKHQVASLASKKDEPEKVEVVKTMGGNEVKNE